MAFIEKMDILNKLQQGMSVVSVGLEYSVNESTIHTICNCGEKNLH